MIRRCILLLAPLALLAVLGCTSASDSDSPADGPSLTDRYEAAMRVSDPGARARDLMAVAVAQHAAKDSAGAKKSLSEAEKAGRKLEDNLARSSVYTRLASTYARLNQPYEAGQALKTAQQAALELETAEAQARALCSIGEVQGAKLDNPDTARLTLAKSLDLAQTVEDPEGRLTVLGSIATAYARSKLAAEAEQVIDRALADAGAIENPVTRAAALTAIAAAQVNMGQKEPAQATLAQAEAAAKEIEDHYKRVYRLRDIILQYIAAGNGAKANALYDQAKTVADGIQQSDSLNEARKLLGELKRELP